MALLPPWFTDLPRLRQPGYVWSDSDNDILHGASESPDALEPPTHSLLTAIPSRQMEPWYSGTTGTRQALLTAILELGAWIGALVNGYLADAVGRRITVVIACAIFTVGVIIQACTLNKDYVLAGRFVTGIGVGAFSMLVPLYVPTVTRLASRKDPFLAPIPLTRPGPTDTTLSWHPPRSAVRSSPSSSWPLPLAS